ncbi:terminase large subunit [Arthrobacter phage Bolt007]|uniref:Terminase large subunit n=1 Tax=Arthrobacter phage Bolt007 TaxID=3017297 RepID=A0AA49I7D7_9CAUD|nr:terminase large subunit [Arthrobacter phage Bolt007]
MPTNVTYDYAPHPGPQTLAHTLAVDELLYGGAAGGGKSRWARAVLVEFCLSFPGVRAILFRRTFADLERSVVEPLLNEIPRELGKYNASKHQWRFVNGSILELGHLQKKTDQEKYQGAEYQMICFEEATHFTEEQYLYMKSRLRAAGRIRDLLLAAGLRPRFIATANPGGIGHHWVKGRFVDLAPAGRVFRVRPSLQEPNPGTRVYLPAKATDNPSLGSEYHDMLNSLPDATRKALRDGNWDALEGVRFPSFNRQVHVIEPEELPIPHGTATRAIGVDYGSAAPFAGLWGAKLSDNLVVVYREVYRTKLSPRQQARLLAESEAPGERLPNRPIPLALDPSMWARSVNQPTAVAKTKGGPPPGSIAAQYQEEFGSAVVKAQNDRIGGAALVDDLLRVRDDGLPRLLIYSNCVNLIRTLPALPRDSKRPEDVETTAEDHAYDALRYLAQELVGTAPRHQEQVETLGEVYDSYTGDLAGARF